MTEYIIVKKPKRRFRRNPEETSMENISLVDLLRHKKEEVKALEEFWKEQEKINKKDDPKKGKEHQFTFTEGLLLAFFLQYTLAGPGHGILKAIGVQ